MSSPDTPTIMLADIHRLLAEIEDIQRRRNEACGAPFRPSASMPTGSPPAIMPPPPADSTTPGSPVASISQGSPVASMSPGSPVSSTSSGPPGPMVCPSPQSLQGDPNEVAAYLRNMDPQTMSESFKKYYDEVYQLLGNYRSSSAAQGTPRSRPSTSRGLPDSAGRRIFNDSPQSPPSPPRFAYRQDLPVPPNWENMVSPPPLQGSFEGRAIEYSGEADSRQEECYYPQSSPETSGRRVRSPDQSGRSLRSFEDKAIECPQSTPETPGRRVRRDDYSDPYGSPGSSYLQGRPFRLEDFQQAASASRRSEASSQAPDSSGSVRVEDYLRPMRSDTMSPDNEGWQFGIEDLNISPPPEHLRPPPPLGAVGGPGSFMPIASSTLGGEGLNRSQMRRRNVCNPPRRRRDTPQVSSSSAQDPRNRFPHRFPYPSTPSASPPSSPDYSPSPSTPAPNVQWYSSPDIPMNSPPNWASRTPSPSPTTPTNPQWFLNNSSMPQSTFVGFLPEDQQLYITTPRRDLNSLQYRPRQIIRNFDEDPSESREDNQCPQSEQRGRPRTPSGFNLMANSIYDWPSPAPSTPPAEPHEVCEPSGMEGFPAVLPSPPRTPPGFNNNQYDYPICPPPPAFSDNQYDPSICPPPPAFGDNYEHSNQAVVTSTPPRRQRTPVYEDSPFPYPSPPPIVSNFSPIGPLFDRHLEQLDEIFNQFQIKGFDDLFPPAAAAAPPPPASFADSFEGTDEESGSCPWYVDESDTTDWAGEDFTYNDFNATAFDQCPSFQNESSLYDEYQDLPNESSQYVDFDSSSEYCTPQRRQLGGGVDTSVKPQQRKQQQQKQQQQKQQQKQQQNSPHSPTVDRKSPPLPPKKKEATVKICFPSKSPNTIVRTSKEKPNLSQKDANEALDKMIDTTISGLGKIVTSLKKRQPIKRILELPSDRDKLNVLLQESIAQTESSLSTVRRSIRDTLSEMSDIISKRVAVRIPEVSNLVNDIESLKSPRKTDKTPKREVYTTVAESDKDKTTIEDLGDEEKKENKGEKPSDPDH